MGAATPRPAPPRRPLHVRRHYVFLPITTVIASPRTVDAKGRQWNRLKTAINQPDLL